MYNKNIVFAFKNFKNEKNIPALINQMSYNFYAVRFIAAEDLLEYGDIYYSYITDDVISQITNNKLWLLAFIKSLANLGDNNFKTAVEKILNHNISNDNAMKYNITEVLKEKKDKVKDKNVKAWIEKIIKE